MSTLHDRAAAVASAVADVHPSIIVVETEALPGAGSAPGITMPSVGVRITGDLLGDLRRHDPPVIARSRDDHTLLDLRSVSPGDDDVVIAALRASDPT